MYCIPLPVSTKAATCGCPGPRWFGEHFVRSGSDARSPPLSENTLCKSSAIRPFPDDDAKAFSPRPPNGMPCPSSMLWQASGPRSSQLKKSGSAPNDSSGSIPCGRPTRCNYPRPWSGRKNPPQAYFSSAWTSICVRRPSKRDLRSCRINRRPSPFGLRVPACRTRRHS